MYYSQMLKWKVTPHLYLGCGQPQGGAQPLTGQQVGVGVHGEGGLQLRPHRRRGGPRSLGGTSRLPDGQKC